MVDIQMKKIIAFLGFLFLCEDAVSYASMSDALYINRDISSQKKGYLSKCAERGIKKCQMELGYDYVIRGRWRNEDMSNNFVQAQKWLKLSSEYPYSRYLLGYASWIKSDENSSAEKYGVLLIQSACYEGVEDACANAAKYYNLMLIRERERGIVIAPNDYNIKKQYFIIKKQ